MMTHEAPEDRTPAGRSGPHRLLPIAGITVVVFATLAHFLAGGAALAHFGLGAALANLGGGALILGLAAIIAIKVLMIFGARQWWRRRGE